MRHPPLAPALLLLVVAGCHDPPTEVVLVLESDLLVPTEADTLQFATVAGPSAPALNDFTAAMGGGQLFGLAFPLSLGFRSGGATSAFSLTLQLTRTSVFPAAIVISRTITNIRFVDQQTMMLVVPLLRACACQGTSCPNPGDPDCDTLASPPLEPLDPAVAPPSTMMGGSGLPVQPQPVRQPPGAL